jgi:endoglucanase
MGAPVGFVALFGAALLVVGCSGVVNTTPIVSPTASPSPSPTASPSPSPTASPVPLSVAPTSLSFSASTSTVQSLTITDGTAGPYVASGCSGIVSAAVTGSAVSVTALAGGTCTLTISDPASQSVGVAISVTTVSVPVH